MKDPVFSSLQLGYDNVQRIILDHDGIILSSSDRIFPTAAYQGHPIFEDFPLLESIFDQICALPLENIPLRIRGVNYSFTSQPRAGYYDYAFYRISRGPENYILWNIYDRTTYYQAHRAIQQERNESHLKS